MHTCIHIYIDTFSNTTPGFPSAGSHPSCLWVKVGGVTPWTSGQFITGSRDKQPSSLTFSPTYSSDLPISLMCLSSDCGSQKPFGKKQRKKLNPLRRWTQMQACATKSVLSVVGPKKYICAYIYTCMYKLSHFFSPPNRISSQHIKIQFGCD